MKVISSIIYHYLSIISNLGFHHSLKYYHFQSYVYIRVYTFIYLNYKFSGFSHLTCYFRHNLAIIAYIIPFSVTVELYTKA